MNILKAGYDGVNIIDPQKKKGEDGQCIKLEGNNPDLLALVMHARKNGMEIRWYYRKIVTSNGIQVPAKVIITEIPSGHIQPWHLHQSIHEISRVDEGRIWAIDAPETMDREEIAKRGTVLSEGDMVIEDPGVRHTIANLSDEPAILTTVQVANIPFEQFNVDWK